MTRRSEHPLTRLVAVLAALCVLALAVFAASPSWHASLHNHHDVAGAAADAATPNGPDHACAVTLFAQGALTLLVFSLLILARPRLTGQIDCAPGEIAPPAPRYRHVPSHAPPVA